MTERERTVFDLVVVALGAFSSKEMGGLLVDLLPDHVAESMGNEAGEITREKITRLVAAVDVALQAAEGI